MELLTVKEVSKILKINVSDTYKLIKKGHIQALKLGSFKVTSVEIEIAEGDFHLGDFFMF